MVWEQALLLGIYLLLVNLATFAAFALDKKRAIDGRWRVREVSLLRMALFGGWPGAKLAQFVLLHKTRKQPFGRVLNLIGVVHLALALLAAAAMTGWIGGGVQGPEMLAASAEPSGWHIDWTLFSPEREPEPVMPRRFGPGS